MTSITVFHCIKALQVLIQRGAQVTIHWVKAHDGNKLNEEVDRLAKFGTTSQWTYVIPTSWAHIKNMLHKTALKEWYHRWKNSTTCRQTKLFLPCYYPQFSQFLWKLDRHTLSKMIQLVTGHNYLSYHLKNISKVNTSVCRKCHKATEMAWHLVTCLLYTSDAADE